MDFITLDISQQLFSTWSDSVMLIIFYHPELLVDLADTTYIGKPKCYLTFPND